MNQLKIKMPNYKRYSKAEYLQGALNLLRNEREVIIKALVVSDWNMQQAFRLNYPKENITISAYNWLLLRHHISVKDRSWKDFKEIN